MSDVGETGMIIEGSGQLLYMFADALPLLETGDVLLAVGKDNDLMAVGVRAITNSQYTHAGIVRVDHGFPIVYEATGIGTDDRHLKEWAKRRYQKVSVFRPSAKLDEDALITFLLENKGKSYDVAQIGRILWRELRRNKSWGLDPDADKFDCSEYVSAALVASSLIAGGADPCRKDDAWTYPGDLAISPALEHIFDFVI